MPYLQEARMIYSILREFFYLICSECLVKRRYSSFWNSNPHPPPTKSARPIPLRFFGGLLPQRAPICWPEATYELRWLMISSQHIWPKQHVQHIVPKELCGQSPSMLPSSWLVYLPPPTYMDCISSATTSLLLPQPRRLTVFSPEPLTMHSSFYFQYEKSTLIKLHLCHLIFIIHMVVLPAMTAIEPCDNWEKIVHWTTSVVPFYSDINKQAWVWSIVYVVVLHDAWGRMRAARHDARHEA